MGFLFTTTFFGISWGKIKIANAKPKKKTPINLFLKACFE